jgi:ribulose-bisphosphate carboxylase large chain
MATTTERLLVTYRVRGEAATIADRAQALAVEQSVEMPLAAIDVPRIATEIVGAVQAIEDRGGGVFDLRISLATATMAGPDGPEAGQILNMVFGNSSLHEDVMLWDIDLPAGFAALCGGPHWGIGGLRERLCVGARAITATALKPQGLSPDELATLAGRLAAGGIDVIKDDHGIADQRYAPFAARVRACAEKIAENAVKTGHPTRYAPNLSGSLDALRRQVEAARAVGIDLFLIAPFVVGFPAFATIARENPDLGFLAHPAMAGAARINPALLYGKLFRLFGADAVIYPNHGGRFGYTPAICREIAAMARGPLAGLAAALPVPAGGMTPARVAEMLAFYGPDTMLLIGGALLSAGPHLVEETRTFVRAVAETSHG